MAYKIQTHSIKIEAQTRLGIKCFAGGVMSHSGILIQSEAIKCQSRKQRREEKLKGLYKYFGNWPVLFVCFWRFHNTHYISLCLTDSCL